MANEYARYARQIIFSGIGQEGQEKLLNARVALVGCGATGTLIADRLVRAGVGHLILIDRDFIELNNLQRRRPKRRKRRRIASRRQPGDGRHR